MSNETTWVLVGFVAQGIFTARFVVQWVASERRRESIVPAAFWWLSLLGGATLLTYAIHRRDPVFSVGQGMGLFIYIRNIMLVEKARARADKRQHLQFATEDDSGDARAELQTSTPHRAPRAAKVWKRDAPGA